jgi:hypothetical protein
MTPKYSEKITYLKHWTPGCLTIEKGPERLGSCFGVEGVVEPELDSQSELGSRVAHILDTDSFCKIEVVFSREWKDL